VRNYYITALHILKLDFKGIEKYKKLKKTSRRNKPKEEWINIPVPALIEEDLFNRTRNQIEKNFAMCKRNKKNQYLLAGKIWCDCGKRRAGEGAMKGKHLYYRCTDRVYSFPLPPVCKEKGANARVADELIWCKLVNLMSSPELMSKQVSRWMKSRKDKAKASVGDIGSLEKEITKLKKEEDRYNKAYGSGLFGIEKLKEYTSDLKERITSLESQIGKNKQESKEIDSSSIPTQKEIEKFSRESVEVLKSLSFNLKREIVINIIDRVVGNRERLKVYGYIPVTTKNVAFKTKHRNSLGSTNHYLDKGQGIPFELKVKLPPRQKLFGNP